MPDLYAHRQAFCRYANRFTMTFGRKCEDFYDPLFGLDVIAFDDWLIEKHGDYQANGARVSMKQFIIKQYGSQAAMIVEALI